jgi:AraC-like DNA-binding protein
MFIHFQADNCDMDFDDSAAAPDKLLIPTLIHDTNREIANFFTDVTNTFSSDLPFKEMRCSMLLNLLLIKLSDVYQHKTGKHDELIRELLELINGNPQKFFTIDELANNAGITPKTLKTRFSKETGFSVHQYQMNKKLNLIALLLQNNSYISLKNTAGNYGFYDEYHLSNSFKKKFGISPKKYSGKN